MCLVNCFKLTLLNVRRAYLETIGPKFLAIVVLFETKNWRNPTLKSVKNPIKLGKTFLTLKELFKFRAREQVHNVDFWMESFLRNIGTVIDEDGEEVLLTTMQPVNMDY